MNLFELIQMNTTYEYINKHKFTIDEFVCIYMNEDEFLRIYVNLYELK
jgi:hypothetical protein